MNVSETATDTPQPADEAPLIAEPKTAVVRGRPFQKGQSGNVLGRPRKGETIAERVKRRDDAVLGRALKARDKRLALHNAVGAREWSTYLAYNLGLPAQKFIVSQGQTVADVTDAKLLALNAPLYIEEPRAADSQP